MGSISEKSEEYRESSRSNIMIIKQEIERFYPKRFIKLIEDKESELKIITNNYNLLKRDILMSSLRQQVILNEKNSDLAHVFKTFNENLRPTERARVFYEYNIVRFLRDKFDYLVVTTFYPKYTLSQKLETFMNT